MIIAWGVDRDAARRTLDAALASTSVLGLTTNIGFLRTILADPDVAAGSMDTALVERIAAAVPAHATPISASVAATLASMYGDQPDAPSGAGWHDRRGWRLGEPAWVPWTANTGDGHAVELGVRATPEGYEVLDGERVTPASFSLSGGRLQLDLDGETIVFDIATVGRTTWVSARGDAFSLTRPDRVAPGAVQVREGGASITSPMPGTVVSVLVATGDAVVIGQPVLVVEAMKMEHMVRAPPSTVPSATCS